MHLIFSENTDFPTNRVIDWLQYYNADFQKHIGPTENKDHFTFFNKEFSFRFGGKEAIENYKIFDDTNEYQVDSTWFRRPNHSVKDFTTELNAETTYPKKLLEYTAQKRIEVLWSFLGNTLEKNKSLGSFKITELNKPTVLKLAEENGLTIPKTLITNNFKELKAFFNDCNTKIITKSLHEVMPEHRQKTDDENKLLSYHQYTVLINNLTNVPKVFAPSLFQENIEKEYEIRTIFLNNSCYSACIFSQLNEKTKVDLRNRESNTPMRYMPYKLNKEVENSIKKLMNKLSLNYGAIDLIKCTNGAYYFLEINPVGQYGDVSLHCNYYLNKKIADHLIS